MWEERIEMQLTEMAGAYAIEWLLADGEGGLQGTATVRRAARAVRREVRGLVIAILN